MYIIPYIQISELYFDRLLRTLFNLLTTHRISVAAMIVIFNGKMC